MKIKISESKIRQVVQEEMLKEALTKVIKEQKWPTYTAYLGAEILRLEWDQKLQENNNLNQQPSPEWIAETASAFGLSEAEIAEATEIMNNEELDEGVKGFFKAVAKPYQNLWQTFTNITQHAANVTDPEAKDDVQAAAQVADKLPEPEEMQQVQQPDELMQYIKQILDLLKKADGAIEGDAIQPGLEGELDDATAAVAQAAQTGAAELKGGEEGAEGEEGAAGGGEAFVYKGKGGKGLQSFLARGASSDGIALKGKAMGAVLKHIEKQLKAQGVTVNESVLDEIQGWMWYGLVEGAMQQHYGAPITLQEILDEKRSKSARRKAKQARRKKRRKAKGVGGAEMARRQHQSDAAKAGMMDRAKGAAEPEAAPAEEPAVEEPAAEEPAAEEPAAEEAPIEEVPPTVQNTAPEGSPVVKVFKGKGGEGLQSALAKNRDALGIDQQTVAVIIKAVEKWAQANQIKVENVTADTFDSIINEIVPRYRARKLQETINKLKNV